MKLLISIVQDADVNFLMDALTESGYRVTKLSTTGGFLKGKYNSFNRCRRRKA